MLDDYQEWISSVYRGTILQIVKDSPGLNVKQIASRVPAGQEKFLESIRSHFTKAREWRLSPGKSRDTVRKHLYAMLSDGEVEKIGQGYFVRQSPVSVEPNKAVTQLLSDSLSRNSFEEWRSPLAHNVASCRIASDPAWSHHELADLFAVQTRRFTRSLFWLDDILEDAIVRERLSDDVYSERMGARNSIDMDLLEKGWKSYFGNTKLFSVTFAISPPEFLNFLKSPIGHNLAIRHLKRTWNWILENVEKDRLDRQRLKRQRHKRQLLEQERLKKTRRNQE